MIIQTKSGSATSAKPIPEGDVTPLQGVIIAHLCNNVGAWGSGFVLAVNDLSLAAKMAYKAFCKDHNNKVPLGTTQFVEVAPNVWIANMIAQDGIDKSAVADGCLVSYSALNTCLKVVCERAVLLGCNVHIPSGMGSGLAGGDEKMIHGIIETRATCTPIDLLERMMKFMPRVTLWEFDDKSAASFVPTASKQAMVASVLGSPDGDELDVDTVLDDIGE